MHSIIRFCYSCTPLGEILTKIYYYAMIMMTHNWIHNRIRPAIPPLGQKLTNYGANYEYHNNCIKICKILQKSRITLWCKMNNEITVLWRLL